MRISVRAIFILPLLLLNGTPAHAEFIISSAIVEFTQDGPRQQDIETISRGKDDDYLVSEISEIIDPGLFSEKRRVIDDPSDSLLLVTPDKMLLPAGTTKVLRFVLLKEPDANEHVYRVAIKPIIKGINSNAHIGIKVLIGYEALVIVRPAAIQSNYTAVRNGKTLTVTNHGNSNLMFQAGRQCDADVECPAPPVRRIYPGQNTEMPLPQDKPVTYTIWDGKDSVEKTF